MLSLEILAPDKPAVHYEAVEVLLPSAAGVMSVRPGHTPLLTQLDPGAVIIYDQNEQKHFYAQAGGFAEIKNNHISILTEIFEHGQEIDLKRAEAAKARAEDLLKKSDENPDIARAEFALARSLARIQAHHGHEY